MLSVVGYNTYKTFAKIYKIPLTTMKNNKRVKKSIRQLQKEIYDFEEANKHFIQNNGLYF